MIDLIPFVGDVRLDTLRPQKFALLSDL